MRTNRGKNDEKKCCCEEKQIVFSFIDSPIETDSQESENQKSENQESQEGV
jgi:hypothetical protein